MSAADSDQSPDPLREILGLLGHLAQSADPVILAGVARLTSAFSQLAGLRSGVEDLRADIGRIEHNTAETVRLLTELRDLLATTPTAPNTAPTSDTDTDSDSATTSESN